MSYQSTYRSMSNPAPSYPLSPQSSVRRKSAAHSSSVRGLSPLANGTHTTSKPADYLFTPTSSTPLTSFPPNGTVNVAPSYTSPIATSYPTPPPQSLYSSPTTTGPVDATQQPSLLKPLDPQETDEAMRACLDLQIEAVTEHSKRPFAALLLGPDNKKVLLTHNSISHYQHAESELARLAAAQYSPTYLERCTLVSTWEPCAMCAGTIYWAGLGRVLYAASEAKLKDLTGTDNPENMTMSLPCRVVFDAGQRTVEVLGPIPSWESKVVDESGKWWKEHAANQFRSNPPSAASKDSASIYSHRTSVSVYNPNDSALGSIGEDGEYQADLKIDWMP